jgi:hypothetical protein
MTTLGLIRRIDVADAEWFTEKVPVLAESVDNIILQDNVQLEKRMWSV